MSRSGSLTDVFTETRVPGVPLSPFELDGGASDVACGATDVARLGGDFDGGFGRDFGCVDGLREDGPGGIVAEGAGGAALARGGA